MCSSSCGRRRPSPWRKPSRDGFPLIAPQNRLGGGRQPPLVPPRMSTIASGPAAVVVGLDCVTGLQTARILHDRAIPVIGVAGDPAHFACRSRAVGRLVGADVTSEQLISAL